MKDTVHAPPADSEIELSGRPVSASEFRAFVDPHWSVMTAFARRAAAAGTWEDVLQDALTTAWRKRRQYDGTRGSGRSWLLSIIADKVYKQRRRGPRAETPLFDPGVVADRTEILDVRRAVAQLTSRQRMVVSLRYYHGFSTDETAQVMRCSTGTVKSTLSDAKKQIKSILGKDYDND